VLSPRRRTRPPAVVLQAITDMGEEILNERAIGSRRVLARVHDRPRVEWRVATDRERLRSHDPTLLLVPSRAKQ
jgi:hypothetical protein